MSCVHISVTEWLIVGYLCDALKDLRDMYVYSIKTICFIAFPEQWSVYPGILMNIMPEYSGHCTLDTFASRPVACQAWYSLQSIMSWHTAPRIPRAFSM